MECNKDEAIRAMDIAKRKVTENDFSGAKTFAVKAQNLYPQLDGLKQVLMLIDVYVSAGNKINGEEEPDWYGVLGVDPLADDGVVKKQYRRLALLLHPDKNKCDGAEGAFKLISEAWSLLSDKVKRIAYDQKRRVVMMKEVNKPRKSRKQKQEPKEPKQPSKKQKQEPKEPTKKQKQPPKEPKQPAKKQPKQPAKKQKQPGTKQEPTNQQEQPPKQDKQPAYHQEQPAYHQEQPPKQPEQPAYHQEQPPKQYEQPTNQPEQPAKQQKPPSNQQEEPTNQHEQPAKQQKQPANQQKQPAYQPEQPAKQHEQQQEQPAYQQKQPTYQPEQPAKQHEEPPNQPQQPANQQKQSPSNPQKQQPPSQQKQSPPNQQRQQQSPQKPSQPSSKASRKGRVRSNKPTPKVSTFWTVCNICETKHAYIRVYYLNKNVKCQNCNVSFKAIEIEKTQQATEVNTNGASRGRVVFEETEDKDEEADFKVEERARKKLKTDGSCRGK